MDPQIPLEEHMEQFLQGLAAYTPSSAAQTIFAFVLFALSLVVLVPAVRNITMPDSSDQEFGKRLVFGIGFGALTGLLWFLYNPVMIVPPFIHLRLFAFLPPLVGILFGPLAGFLCGYIGTMVWAPLAGAFVPLHSPLADGIFVGLTGVLPYLALRGNRSNGEFLAQINRNKGLWIGRALLVGLATGLFMSFFAALSLQFNGVLPFWVGFWAIGVVSDTLPIMIGLAFIVPIVLAATRPAWTWLPQPRAQPSV